MAWKIDFDYVSAQPDFDFDPAPDGTTPWGFGWGWGRGSRVAEAQVPQSARQKDNNRLVDVFPLPGFSCVNKRFRDVVESFEPNTHQFFPITLRSKKGVTYDEPYFLINVCQTFDSIMVGNSNTEWRVRLAGGLEGMPYVSRPNPPRLISRPTIAGRHLWRNYWIYEGDIMVSDDLRDALLREKIIRLKLKEPRAQYYEEVDSYFTYQEQAPAMLDWMETNRPSVMFDQHLDWIKTYTPHWLA